MLQGHKRLNKDGDMTRRALIISNPGEQGDEQYCRGVFRDVANYRNFLTSSCGGFWDASTVKELARPSTVEVRQAIRELAQYDYALVVFTGHGWYSTDLESTVFTLKAGQEIDSSELQQGPPKQTIILDCCRVKSTGLPLDESVIRASEALLLNCASSRLDPAQCRLYYTNHIENCDRGSSSSAFVFVG